MQSFNQCRSVCTGIIGVLIKADDVKPTQIQHKGVWEDRTFVPSRLKSRRETKMAANIRMFSLFWPRPQFHSSHRPSYPPFSYTETLFGPNNPGPYRFIVSFVIFCFRKRARRFSYMKNYSPSSPPTHYVCSNCVLFRRSVFCGWAEARFRQTRPPGQSSREIPLYHQRRAPQ